jgi:hypothetical protein
MSTSSSIKPQQLRQVIRLPKEFKQCACEIVPQLSSEAFLEAKNNKWQFSYLLSNSGEGYVIREDSPKKGLQKLDAAKKKLLETLFCFMISKLVQFIEKNMDKVLLKKPWPLQTKLFTILCGYESKRGESSWHEDGMESHRTVVTGIVHVPRHSPKTDRYPLCPLYTRSTQFKNDSKDQKKKFSKSRYLDLYTFGKVMHRTPKISQQEQNGFLFAVVSIPETLLSKRSSA